MTEGTELEFEQLRLSLRRRIPNFFFHPLVKSKRWDGYIEFCDKHHRFSVGLWGEVAAICEEFGYEFNLTGLEKIVDYSFDEEKFNTWVDNFFKEYSIKPRDYQIEAAYKILKWRRSVSEIATSAGKTLIMYIVFAYLLSEEKIIGPYEQKYLDEDGKNQVRNTRHRMLIIVPNVSLILQTYEKFLEYSENKNLLNFKIQTLGGGSPKIEADVDIIIGTFQTLSKMDPVFFEQISVVCVDEAHYTNTVSIKNVLKNCDNAHIRTGLSGTMKQDGSANALTIQALLGPMVNKISANYLFKRGFATPINIRMVYMNYLSEDLRGKLKALHKKKKEIGGSKLLSVESDLIRASEERLKYIVDFVLFAKTNSLVLFRDVQGKYGRKIYDDLKAVVDNDTEVYYVDGSVNKNIREEYRLKMNKTDKRRIMVASYATFSTGIDINNLYNIFLVESYKSEVFIKQSIGRGMRLMQGKEFVNVIDLIDDFSIGRFQNYTLKHSIDREEIYKQEKYKYKKVYVDFD